MRKLHNERKSPSPRLQSGAAPTSWENSERWYHALVGENGHYYHQNIILPGVLRLMDSPTAVLDIACGTGVLSRHLPAHIDYTGIDAAPSLIKEARQAGADCPKHLFQLGDVTQPLKLDKHHYSHAALILALQNIEHPLHVFKNAHKHLAKDGKFIMVLNHPCFRIPRQSSWQIDEGKKLQYRRIDSYMSFLNIPIQTHPGKGKGSQTTTSFHRPLSAYFSWLSEAGFVVEKLEEWCSDKTSTGSAAKMENRSREEFPLFLAIRAGKIF